MFWMTQKLVGEATHNTCSEQNASERNWASGEMIQVERESVQND